MLVAAASLTWLCVLLGPLSWLLPVVVIVGLLYFVRHRRFVAALLLLFATPLTFSFLTGLVDYANGDAKLRYSGYPGTQFYNLDPEMRCGRETYGCVVDGDEWVTQKPYNYAVRWATACFGWMPGTYEGPYPTEDEARLALKNGLAVSIGDLENDCLTLDGDRIELDENVGHELLRPPIFPAEFSEEPASPMTAAVWQRECIVLRIPVEGEPHEGRSSAVIVLISRSAGRPFAFFPEGNYYHGFPPVQWKRSR